MERLILVPNKNINLERNDFADTKVHKITIVEKIESNQETQILLDTTVSNWAAMLRNVLEILRPIIDEIVKHYDFETLFNNAMVDVLYDDKIRKTPRYNLDKNFSEKLFTDDSFIKSEFYKNNKNHKLLIMVDSQGIEKYICAVYTCEVVCVLQALIQAISVSRNIEILIQYEHRSTERVFNKQIKEFKALIEESNNIVFFGGAGVSTESGIPDFRSQNGLYNQHYDYPPEEILSHTFFMNHTDEFYKFYKDKMNCLKYEPNITHKKLAKLESKGKLKAIITQNIDSLHQKAGSKNVLELHGSVLRNYCMKCHKSYNAEDVFNSNGIPKCACGGIIKPDVVLYEESLNHQTLMDSINAIQNADLLIVAGTSLTVQPASSLLNYFQGNNIVLINKDITAYDYKATLRIKANLGQVFQKI